MLALVIFGFLVKAEAPTFNKKDVQKAEVQAVGRAEQTHVEEAVVSPQPIPQPEPVITHPTGCENYRQLVAQAGLPVDIFLRIASAESGCNPYAVGDQFEINGIYAPSCGLFQIRTLAGRPSCEELKDPATNIAWAYRIYQGQGLGAWSVCTNGKANCY